MAVDISDLTSLYSPDLFQSGTGSVILEEKQQNAGALSSVEILTPGEYEEVGLIVSFPPKPSDKYDDSNNDMVLENKTEYAALQNNAENKFDKGFRQHGMVNANVSDFPTLDQSKLHYDIKFNTLDIYHHTVNGNNWQQYSMHGIL